MPYVVFAGIAILPVAIYICVAAVPLTVYEPSSVHAPGFVVLPAYVPVL